jgi:hypothetical protein
MKGKIKKRYFVFVLILLGVAFVIAAVPNPGHALTELEVPAGCANGNVVKLSSGVWVCGIDGGGSGGAVNSVTGGDFILANPTTGDVIVDLESCTGAEPYLSWSVADSEWKCSTGTGASGHPDGTNCPAGQAPLGVDANGNSQGCWTPTGSGHGDGSNCGSNQAAIGVDANGNAQGCWTPSGGGGSGDFTDVYSGVGIDSTNPSGPTTTLNYNCNEMVTDQTGGIMCAPNLEVKHRVYNCNTGFALEDIDIGTGAGKCVSIGGGGGGSEWTDQGSWIYASETGDGVSIGTSLNPTPDKLYVFGNTRVWGSFKAESDIYSNSQKVRTGSPSNSNCVGQDICSTDDLTADDDLYVASKAFISGTVLGSGFDLGWQQNDGELVYFSSSERYKKNIDDLELGLKTVEELRPVIFDWKNGDGRDLGFIAEEVENVDPILALYTTDGLTESVKYRQMTAVLVKAIQEQQDLIESQQHQIDSLLDVVCKKSPWEKVCLD